PQRQSFGLRQRLHRSANILQEERGVDWFAREVKARLAARELQQIFGQSVEALGFKFQIVERAFVLGGAARLCARHIENRLNRREGRSQIVGSIRRKLALALNRSLQTLQHQIER